jgi:hypothetical protein
MKQLPLISFLWLLLTQLAPAQQPMRFPGTGIPGTPGAAFETDAEQPKFDLDFPGGSPKALVAAIEKATSHRLNAIVPTEYESIQMPPVKVTGATVPSLFNALLAACQNTYVHTNGWILMNFGFSTRDQGTNAVWYFFANRQPEPQPQKFCRFYQLADYLTDYKVEDITTAIQTGWQLLGVKSPPELKFHPETKLLIAVGPQEELATIESVLQQLRKAPSPLPMRGLELPPKKAGS